jgi:hypothetical protein
MRACWHDDVAYVRHGKASNDRNKRITLATSAQKLLDRTKRRKFSMQKLRRLISRRLSPQSVPGRPRQRGIFAANAMWLLKRNAARCILTGSSDAKDRSFQPAAGLDSSATVPVPFLYPETASFRRLVTRIEGDCPGQH